MSITYIGLESARQLRNARGLIFTFAILLVMLLVFGSAYGSGGAMDKTTGLPWVVVTTIQMTGYGAMMAALRQTFNNVAERSPLGWNRQLSVTPLSGTGYLVSKVVSALAVSIVSIVLLNVVSVIVLGAKLSLLSWSMAAVGLWAGVIPFALIAVLIGQFAKPSYAQPCSCCVLRHGHPRRAVDSAADHARLGIERGTDRAGVLAEQAGADGSQRQRQHSRTHPDSPRLDGRARWLHHLAVWSRCRSQLTAPPFGGRVTRDDGAGEGGDAP